MSWLPLWVSTDRPMTGRSFSWSSPWVGRASRAIVVVHVLPRSVDLAKAMLTLLRLSGVSQAWVARYSVLSRPHASGAWKMLELLARQNGYDGRLTVGVMIFQVVPASVEPTRPQPRLRISMNPPKIIFGSFGFTTRYGAL